MARRRRPSTRRTYSLAHLLEKQPKGLRRNAHYREMIAHYRSSDRLKALRVNGRCYSLLNRAVLAPENLHHFYRTYRLPADPFFPLFFAIKRDYLAERERITAERKEYIRGRLRSLPAPVYEAIKYLGHLERHLNGAGDSPIWQKHLFPGSKRRADQYTHRSLCEWIDVYTDHLELLEGRYRGLSSVVRDRIQATLALGIIPPTIPPNGAPGADEVRRAYRRLSLAHHPDRGGDPEVFIRLKAAQDLLLSSRSSRRRASS